MPQCLMQMKSVMFAGGFPESFGFYLSCLVSVFSEVLAKCCPLWKTVFFFNTEPMAAFIGPVFFVCFHNSGIDKNLKDGARIYSEKY